MGLVYTVQMQDDFNWQYIGKTKANAIEVFTHSFKDIVGYEPTLLAEWHGEMVFDIEKNPPDTFVALKELILRSCDTAIYWHDSNPYDKKRL